MKTTTLTLFSILLLACTKYVCVKKIAPEMIGKWVHLSENSGFHYIYIEKNGKGSMYGVNNHGNNQDTQTRGWYVKDDILYFSRFSNKSKEDKFVINSYPTIASQQIITGYDTVNIADIYMVLNNRIYIRFN